MSQVATLFGLGRLGFAPGTLGSLVALPIAWLIMRFGGMYALLAVTAVVAIAAIWVSDAYAKEIGDDDPKDCIIDEVAGQMLACALAPLSLLGFALAFVLCTACSTSPSSGRSRRWSASAAARASWATTCWRASSPASWSRPRRPRGSSDVPLAAPAPRRSRHRGGARTQKLRIATAESCTERIDRRIADRDRGLVRRLRARLPSSIPASRAKQDLLGVPGDLIAEHGRGVGSRSRA